ncbi:1-acyl-sn-glycerol-3-phosphate acyltransferase [Phycisphaerae bacterium RAS1]|nr:1-acyl-sn-glycerol-3-phosphate acyltransferase [Phycisphaerae bacterium RAS1]
MHAPAFPQDRLPGWLLQNRNFVLLWAAYGVAAIGDHLSEIALLKAAGGLERPDVTRLQALISFGFFLPFVLIGPLAGWWSDRFSRKTTMIAADLLRAALVFNLALIVPWLQRLLDSAGMRDFAIIIPLAVVGALAAFFSPARQAMLPTLIRDDQLVRANALISALGTIGTIISAVVGGYLVQHAGPEWNFHINALTFVLSAAFVASIAMSRTRAVPHPPLEGILTPVAAGFRYVLTHRRIFQMILLGAVFWAAAGAVISVVPAIVKSLYGDNYTAAGSFRGIIGLGLAGGATVMTIIGPTLPLQMAVKIALSAAALWILALDAAFSFGLGKIATGVCLFGIGGAGAALLVTIMATIQRFVPDSRRGRVFGVSDMLTMGAMVVATGALGIPTIANLDRYIPWILLVTAGMFIGVFIAARREYARRSRYSRIVQVMIQLTIFHARFWCRLRRVGPCTVPTRGPVIVVGNHTSFIDPLIIIASSPHRLPAFLVAKEYFVRWPWKWFMSLNHCIPVDRANPGRGVLSASLKLLERDGCLGLFPQGTFAPPGEQEPEAKSGVGLLALRSGATIVPCHISGTRYTDGLLAGFFTRHSVRIRYGPALDLSAFRDQPRTRETADRIAELIMQKIRSLAPDVEP